MCVRVRSSMYFYAFAATFCRAVSYFLITTTTLQSEWGFWVVGLTVSAFFGALVPAIYNAVRRPTSEIGPMEDDWAMAAMGQKSVSLLTRGRRGRNHSFVLCAIGVVVCLGDMRSVA